MNGPVPPINPDISKILSLEEIKQLKARYCRFIDTKQWARLRDLFTEDARFEGLGSAPAGSTVDDFIVGVSNRLREAQTIHHCHTPEIIFPGQNAARGIWAMMDHLEWPASTVIAEAPGYHAFCGFGYYEEEYRLDSTGWKIAFLRLTRLIVRPLSPDRPTPRTGVLAAHMGANASSLDWLLEIKETSP